MGLCGGGLFCYLLYCRTFSSISDVFLLDDISTLIRGNSKCLHTVPNVPWGAQSSLLRNIGLDHLTCSWTSYKWCHRVCTVLCLASFPQDNAFEINSCCYIHCFIHFIVHGHTTMIMTYSLWLLINNQHIFGVFCPRFLLGQIYWIWQFYDPVTAHVSILFLSSYFAFSLFRSHLSCHLIGRKSATFGTCHLWHMLRVTG